MITAPHRPLRQHPFAPIALVLAVAGSAGPAAAQDFRVLRDTLPPDPAANLAPALVPAELLTPRLLLAGDSWAQYMWDDGSHNELFDRFGHGEKRALSRSLGSDPGRFYVRLDFIAAAPPGAEVDLLLEFLSTEPRRVLVRGLETGDRPVRWAGEQGAGESVDGASCRIASILELGVPFRSLGLRTGDRVEFLASLIRGGQPIETLPADDIVRFNVPDETFEAAMWSA